MTGELDLELFLERDEAGEELEDDDNLSTELWVLPAESIVDK